MLTEEKEIAMEEILRQLDLHSFVEQLRDGYSDDRLARENGLDITLVRQLKDAFYLGNSR